MNSSFLCRVIKFFFIAKINKYREIWTAQVADYNSLFHFGPVCHIMMVANLTPAYCITEKVTLMTGQAFNQHPGIL